MEDKAVAVVTTRTKEEVPLPVRDPYLASLPTAPEYEVETSSSCSVDVCHTLRWNVSKVQVGPKSKKKTILQGVVGGTETGELTAIMGPSGAGKTTLIECISLRNRNWEGGLQFDDKIIGGNYFTSSALVHQQELFFGFMKVKEHLYFHAVTRMSHKFTMDQIKQRIKQVLKEANLEKCEDTLIGGTDAAFLAKGLSGGERKRLAIAAELLLTPCIVFLDEPTSGLDSVMAETIVKAMKDLAENGRAVMASIHSPTSEMCTLFTHFLLLTGDGRLAFHGKSEEAASHFNSMGYPLPEDFNPSEFYLQMVSYSPHLKREEEKERMDVMVEAFAKSEHYEKDIIPHDKSHKEFKFVNGLKVSSWTLLKLNVWRGFLKTRRDLIGFMLWGVIAAVVGLLFGTLYYKQASASWRNLLGLVFSVVVVSLLTAAVSEMIHFPMEWGVILREYYAGANAMGPYLGAKFVTELPLNYGPILLSLFLYWLTGMEPKFTTFLTFTGVMMLINQASVSLGLMVSTTSRNPFVALATLPVFISPMIMFSGILYQRSVVPAYLIWLEKISIVNYGFSALMALQIDTLPKASRALLMTFAELKPEEFSFDVSMLVVLSLFFYFGAYINLTLRLRTSAAT